MEFNLSIRSKSGHAIDQPHDVIGTNGIDVIRTTLEVELPIDRIRGFTNEIKTDIQISVIERIARESGMFKHSDRGYVQVLPNQLNEFAHLETHCNRNGDTGEVTDAWLKWVVDKDAILDAWIEAGYPADWRGLPETEETA